MSMNIYSWVFQCQVNANIAYKCDKKKTKQQSDSCLVTVEYSHIIANNIACYVMLRILNTLINMEFQERGRREVERWRKPFGVWFVSLVCCGSFACGWYRFGYFLYTVYRIDKPTNTHTHAHTGYGHIMFQNNFHIELWYTQQTRNNASKSDIIIKAPTIEAWTSTIYDDGKKKSKW